MNFKLLATAVSLAVMACAAPASAVINSPVPTANYITFLGFDWAWAAPCAPNGLSCGADLRLDNALTYQATQGWRYPTLPEFLNRPAVADFGTKCASAWFNSGYSHCDILDAQAGYVWDYGFNITSGGTNPAAETWVIRGGSGTPEPAAWAMMIAGFALAGASLRRRRALSA